MTAGDHEPLAGGKGFDDQSRGMAMERDCTMGPGAQKLRALRRERLGRTLGRPRRALARDHHPRPRPIGQRGGVGYSAAMMRSHQYLDGPWFQREQAVEPRPFQIAREQKRMALVLNQQHETPSVFVSGDAALGRVQHFQFDPARGEPLARM